MKKCISTILIPAILLQLVGCYSQRNISPDELYRGVNEEVSINLNDSTTYVFKENLELEELLRNPEKRYCSKIDFTAENLILYTKKTKSQIGHPPYVLVSDTVVLARDEIKDLSVSEYNALFYIISVGLVVGVLAIALAISDPLDDFKIKLN